jgi:predicted RNA-binding Zn ribbon-like protein
MPRKPPRYDLPNAAPGPLRSVQRFVNTVNLETGEDWLAGWLEDEGVRADLDDLERARSVREAVRALLYENNGQPVDGDPRAALSNAADAAAFSVDFSRPALEVRAPGVDGAVGRVLAAWFTAMQDGSWLRLKCCRNYGCRWAFYDYSKNRSASWCSMQLCGNRTKTRAYRARTAAN